MIEEQYVHEVIRTALQDLVKIARAEAQKIHVAELGIVTEVFPHSSDSDLNNYECDVQLRDKDIILKKVPVVTSQIGLSNIPHTGDMVLLSFLNGDINSPVIMGRLYNDEDRPPISKEEEIVYVPPYTKSDDLRRLYIELPDKSLKLTISEKGIEIEADSDISIRNKGKTTVSCDGELLLKSPSITIDARDSLEIKSGAQLNVSGKLVKVEGNPVKIN